MTETPQTPEAGVAEAFRDLSGQTRSLVRSEIRAAQQEVWDKAKAAMPALALAAGAGVFGAFAAAAACQWSLRLLEKRLPPATAALTATGLYGASAAGAAFAAARLLRRLPLPLPVETAQQADRRVAAAAREAS